MWRQAIAVCVLVGAGAAWGVEPLDPLTPEEKRVAERVATTDAKVREMVGPSRPQLIYSEFIAAKPRGESGAAKEPPVGRHAEVVLYLPEPHAGLRVLVDLRAARVVDVVRLDAGSVPLTRDDLARALSLALANEAVQQMLGPQLQLFRAPAREGREADAVARGLLVHATTESDPCFRRRCVRLFFQVRPGTYLTDSAIVDLAGERVTVQRGSREH